jgi:uncharacterized protein YaiL (DUF2058 family)
MTVGTNEKWRYNGPRIVTTTAHRLESGLVRLTRRGTSALSKRRAEKRRVEKRRVEKRRAEKRGAEKRRAEKLRAEKPLDQWQMKNDK